MVATYVPVGRRWAKGALVLAVGACVFTLETTAGFAAETVKNPGQKAEQSDESDESEHEGEGEGETKTFGLPPVEVEAEPLLMEEERIGEYKQPRWTARRRFPSTRIYVRPRGEADFEFWYTNGIPLDDLKGTEAESQFEFEFGLGHRLQLDLYLVTLQNYANFSGPGPSFQLAEQKMELRWALADWGKIWANPTLYFEAIHVNGGAPKIETKLLLGGELSSGWHAGANLVYEREMGGEFEHEYALTAGISRTIVDALFSIGGELEFEMKDVVGERLDFAAYEFLLGPSLQVFFKPHSHLDLLVLAGAEFEREEGSFETVPLLEPTLVVGYEF